MKRRGYRDFGYAFLVIAASWYLVSTISMLPFIPSPLLVIPNTIAKFVSHIGVHVLYSVYRILAGIMLSVVVGVAMGLAMGYYRRADAFLSPLVYFLYPIPKIAFLPVVMLTLGTGESAKIFMIFIISFFQVTVAARDAAKAIPDGTLHSLYSLGANDRDIFVRVIIPASLPSLVTSVRVSLGTAMSVLFVTETFGTEFGLGFLIVDAWMRINYVDMYSGILILGVVGFLLFLAVDLIEFSICRWKRT